MYIITAYSDTCKSLLDFSCETTILLLYNIYNLPKDLHLRIVKENNIVIWKDSKGISSLIKILNNRLKNS